jgi:hypothetical protein
MSQIELEKNTFDTDPVEQLDDLKRVIQGKIAAQKTLITTAKKSYRDTEKLKLEDHPDKTEKLKNKFDEITALNERLFELEADFKELNRTRDDENEEKIQAALHVVAGNWIDKDPSAAYIIDEQEFTFIREYSSTGTKQNVQLRKMEPPRFVELLASELNLKSWHLPPHRVKDLFNDMGRTFHMSRYSIDPVRWKNNEVYLPIKHMEKYFINNMELNLEEQSKDDLRYFDALMYSLSGGKKENQDHIEKWILHKIKNYKKATTTPDLVIVGHVGGNGKGILQAIIRLMLPAMLSGKANSKTLNSNFNAIMLGKLIVFFDDQNSKEIPLEVVKQLAGADTMIFEPKGKDQYEGEKTHSSAWFNNDLPFKLTPAGQEGGVDRRFSITRTNITFLESLRLMFKRDDNLDMTVEQSKDAAETIVSNILLNRISIANWFKMLEQRHAEVDENYTLRPLHGEDYQYFLAKQESSIEKIWKFLVIPVVEMGGCVPLFVIKELLRHMEGKELSDKTVRTKIDAVATTSKLEVDLERTRIDIRSPKITVKKQCTVIRPKLDSDWRDQGFDWNLVSNLTYTGDTPIGHELIHEDNLVFDTRLTGTEEE